MRENGEARRLRGRTRILRQMGGLLSWRASCQHSHLMKGIVFVVDTFEQGVQCTIDRSPSHVLRFPSILTVLLPLAIYRTAMKVQEMKRKKNQSGISSIVGGHFSWSIHFSEQTVAVYDRRTTRVPRFPPTLTTIPPAVYRTAIKVRKIQKIGMEYRPLSAEVSVPPCAPTLRIPGWSLVTGRWLIF